MSAPTDQRAVRREKIEKIRSFGHNPYAERFERTHTLSQAKSVADEQGDVRVAGRLVSIRFMGKLAFARLYELTGSLQISFKKDVLGEQFAEIKKMIDIGDFIGVSGQMWTTKTGEKTLNVQQFTFLSKSLRPLPEKFHGLTDPEARLRRRYLDLISSEQSRDRFLCRSKVIRTIRSYLDEAGFLEIDTPVLCNKASGAMARPFITHNNALDIDVYLRIAPETYLKRAIAGGFDKVYEFARSFRNEGVDASHLPDFTLLEYYCAYWNYVDNMNFTEELVKHLVQQVCGSKTITYDGRQIDFSGQWPRLSFSEVIEKDCGIAINKYPERDQLLNAIEAAGIRFDDDVTIEGASRATLIDLLYKKVSRPKMINPVFLTHHPLDTSPLARKSDTDAQVVDRFQLVVNGWEVINAYSELVDPDDQRERLEKQAAARDAGDQEAMELDEDFLRCMEYGMPPISGWGMGVDRMVALLTNAKTLRDVVLFPLLRPE